MCASACLPFRLRCRADVASRLDMPPLLGAFFVLPLGSLCPVWLSPGPPSRRFPAPRSRLRVTVCRCVYHTPAVCGVQGCCGVFSTPCPLVIPSFKPIYRERFLCLPVPIFLIEGLSLCGSWGKNSILYVGVTTVLCVLSAFLYDISF